ncbi:MAG: SGNH/GDSL hydrolase family protein [Clostridia bacterium]|nr:SGNH/GDSL hydrolase family protein [Clostridia bacterium]
MKKERIKIIGDSLASGMGTSGSIITSEIIASCNGLTFHRREGGCGWAALLTRACPNLEIINMACDGISSSEALLCWKQLYRPSDSNVLLMLGANDRKRINGMDELFSNLMQMCELVKADGNRPLLLTPSPASAENEARPDRIFKHRDVVLVIREVAKKANAETIDIHTELMGRDIDVEALMRGGDGNHPTDRMSELVFDCVFKELFKKGLIR